MARLRCAALAVLFAGCPEPDPVSPYPQVTVTGRVEDVRGGAIEGARVAIWNAYDTGSASTAVDGTFSLVVDGSDESSSYRVRHDGFRTREGGVTVTAASHETGTIGLQSKDELLFSTQSGDIYTLRAGSPGTLLRLTTAAGAGTEDVERTPARLLDGLTVRWANVTKGTIEEAAWDGSGVHTVWTIDADHTLGGIAWAERGTLALRTHKTTDTQDLTLVEDPSGSTFAYQWPGSSGDFSPPAFGHLGPYEIEGNMVAIAGADGIDTAFPYFDNTFLVPETIPVTQPNDVGPKWSSLRADGTLDLAFQRNYAVFATRVSASGKQNVWSSAVALFGGSGVANVNKLAWAPEPVDADRLALAIHPLSSGSAAYGTGDIVVVSWDHLTNGAATSPQVVYDASATGNPGAANDVSWR